jgi:hypothetical protein
MAVKIAIRELIDINLGHCGRGFFSWMASVMTMATKATRARRQLSTSTIHKRSKTVRDTVPLARVAGCLFNSSPSSCGIRSKLACWTIWPFGGTVPPGAIGFLGILCCGWFGVPATDLTSSITIKYSQDEINKLFEVGCHWKRL